MYTEYNNSFKIQSDIMCTYICDRLFSLQELVPSFAFELDIHRYVAIYTIQAYINVFIMYSMRITCMYIYVLPTSTIKAIEVHYVTFFTRTFVATKCVVANLTATSIILVTFINVCNKVYIIFYYCNIISYVLLKLR